MNDANSQLPPADEGRLDLRVVPLADYVPVHDRGPQDTAHTEMMRLLDLSARQATGIDLLRELLAKRISGANLYSDDGELQDNAIAPFIDFRRDSAKDIARKLEERAAKHFLCCGG